MLTLLVALAAGLGAVSRYGVDQLVQQRTRAALPYGTGIVNVTGSFLLGLVTGLASRHGLPHAPTIVLGAGLAGGYTTLSTWAWETITLAQDRELLATVVNVLGSVAAGLAAAAAGLGLTLI